MMVNTRGPRPSTAQIDPALDQPTLTADLVAAGMNPTCSLILVSEWFQVVNTDSVTIQQLQNHWLSISKRTANGRQPIILDFARDVVLPHLPLMTRPAIQNV